MNRADKLALLSSEIYQELEKAEIEKQAQTLSDKIVNSPTAQKAITDGITKALENKADDEEHEKIKGRLKELSDHDLFEFFKIFANELEGRGIDPAEFEKEFEEEEMEEDEDDETKEEEDMAKVFAYVKTSLTKLAYEAANSNDTESAYIIERCIQKIDNKE
jgi:hypothetical protein